MIRELSTVQGIAMSTTLNLLTPKTKARPNPVAINMSLKISQLPPVCDLTSSTQSLSSIQNGPKIKQKIVNLHESLDR
jgi:hypothetical protein